MAHRSPYEDHRRRGRESESRHDRARGPDASRYGAEGRSWDDAPAGGYRPGGEGADPGPRGRRGYAAAGDYGDDRDRDDLWRERGDPAGGYGEDFSRRFGGASRDHGGHGGRRFTGQGYSTYGGRMTAEGRSAYGRRQGGYAPGAQIWEGEGQDVASDHTARQPDFEPDYLHWRDSQMHELDRVYQAWRDERRQKFSREFDDWRSQRRARGEQAQGSTLSQAGGGYGTPGASSDGDQGGTLQSDPAAVRDAGADDAARKKN